MLHVDSIPSILGLVEVYTVCAGADFLTTLERLLITAAATLIVVLIARWFEILVIHLDGPYG